MVSYILIGIHISDHRDVVIKRFVYASGENDYVIHGLLKKKSTGQMLFRNI